MPHLLGWAGQLKQHQFAKFSGIASQHLVPALAEMQPCLASV